jgi:hypothetical protein
VPLFVDFIGHGNTEPDLYQTLFNSVPPWQIKITGYLQGAFIVCLFLFDFYGWLFTCHDPQAL